MSDKEDKFWDTVSNDLRRALFLRPLTAAEAERECEQAPDVPLTRDQIDAIVRAATGPIRSEPAPTSDEPIDWDKSVIEDEIYALNRNANSKSPEVQRRLDELRRELLNKDDE